jgi:hypothetical protein
MSIDPKQIDPPCTHRGALLDEVQCESCTGKVMAKVFACPIYDRCTPFKNRIPLIRGCRICDDRRPLTAT